MNEDKKAKLEKLSGVFKDIEKQFGKGAVSFLDGDNILKCDVIPSGSLTLDEALGVGGYPKGRVTEIYGPESAGKSTLMMHAIAEAQKMDDVAAYIDVEHAFDSEYAKNIGVKLNKLILSQPSSAEEAMEIALKLAESGIVGLIVIDSVAALVPQAEINGEMGDSHMGLKARLMGQGLRKITPIAAKNNCCIIYINQIRINIKVMFGNPETTCVTPETMIEIEI